VQVQTSRHESEGRTIVCGASNITHAQYVAVALPGAVIHGKVIGATVLRGVASSGMICSADELSWQSERAPGILPLESVWSVQELAAQLGESCYDLHIALPGGYAHTRPMKDIVFEVDNKFITNRADLFGIIGHAREW
jgi:tRNA-binding EMAP/Myf-like protein